jgi:hypothetical protein
LNSSPFEQATVFIPQGKVRYFVTRFEKYALPAPKVERERRYEDMIDRVAIVRLATLRALWTDSPDTYPADDEIVWWEVWLRRHDGLELERLHEFAGHFGLDVGPRRLEFDDRIVTLVRATPHELSSSLDILNDFAEVRRAQETASIFEDMTPAERAEWAVELAERLVPPDPDAPVACILDTGVNWGHPLLTIGLSEADCHTVEPNWGSHDHDGHGTEMAGLALLGDLTPLLATAHLVRLKHSLESVKILPPHGSNDPELYGAITAEATSRVEVQAPKRRRCFSLAVTAPGNRHFGQPTSWSAAIDALAVGRSFDPSTSGLVYLDDGLAAERRLLLVSAGNVKQFGENHLDRSDLEPIQDPGQAWNALTVGAYTNKSTITHPTWNGYRSLAAAGDLAPTSSTSVAFSDPWPIKPDVVLEGGNVAWDGATVFDAGCPDLCVLTTHHKPAEKVFTVSNSTSAATAQAARMAATISAEYPELWPETIRGLIVHSATWTRAMHGHFDGAGGRKTSRARLVRRYGFGVPQLDRALRSANDALTLIAQASISPFKDGKMGEMHLFELPWPIEALVELGAKTVKLRVTLSYFIEPNPARVGWRQRHRYASHGLKFDIKDPTESVERFRKRINQLALIEKEPRPKNGQSSAKWFLGERNRNKGSLHSDFLDCSAADLAERGVIAVYPVSGWWKDDPNRDRSEHGIPYSLIVSIETDALDVDIWTPVASMIGVPIEVTA